MNISRRYFIKSGGIAMLGMASLPSFLQRAVAATVSPNKKKMVVLFQRGAMDGLNVVVPFAEPNYYALRPTIAIPQPNRGGAEAAIDLDGFFGLHPSLQPLLPLFKNGQLAIVQAVGSPDPSRSHFDAQDFMESGTPGVKATDDGWLNRAIQSMPEEKPSPFRAVAFGPYLPRTLQGIAPAVAIPDLKQFKMYGPQQTTEGGFEAMYAQTVDQAMRGVGHETFEAIDQLKQINPDTYQPENGAQYPKGRFGQSLMEIAELFKADVGLEVAFLDSGGWDHHVNEGGVQGQLANLLRDLGQGIAAFHQDMGDRMGDVVFVSMSEFGRTAHENGNHGTDHGHANCMFVMGGDIKGGRVYSRWPGMSQGQLYEGRDLAVTTDYRSVLGEIISKHLGDRDLKSVFPGFANDPRQFLGIVKAQA
ncbi:MAG TPA: DUF1501 domain-containing protein [Candidatus Acidoferrales bacterium]|nr:DUF1501 domain-containing protein [Candidatus Acidoferrales bacterium]